MKGDLSSELLAEMMAVQTVDCHSHTWAPAEYYESGPHSLFNFESYFEREVSIQTLFGLEEDELTDANWRAVNDCMVELSSDPDWYRHDRNLTSVRRYTARTNNRTRAA